MERVIKRITRGLFYHHFGRFLALDAEVRVWQELTASNEQHVKMVTGLMHEPKVFVGSEVFSYRVLASDEHPNGSAWLLRFYETLLFVAVTVPADHRSITGRSSATPGA